MVEQPPPPEPPADSGWHRYEPPSRIRRVVQIDVGWLALLVGAMVLVGIVGLLLWLWPLTSTDDTQLRDDVRQVCERYAGLDLSGMVQLCKQVGMQQVMPEDLGR